VPRHRRSWRRSNTRDGQGQRVHGQPQPRSQHPPPAAAPEPNAAKRLGLQAAMQSRNTPSSGRRAVALCRGTMMALQQKCTSPRLQRATCGCSQCCARMRAWEPVTQQHPLSQCSTAVVVVVVVAVVACADLNSAARSRLVSPSSS
jgi:hypothetical protein